MANERQSSGVGRHRAACAQREGGKGPPPVHLWNPPFCGDLDMRIATDGTWFYLKTPIGRPALVKLFASVLKREGDRYFLVTPVEKVGITVDDAPFLAVEMKVEDGAHGRVLHFRTNVDDWVACGRDHALRFEPESGTGGLKPYLHVRRDLWAKVTRALFYDLVELGEERDVAGAAHVRRRVGRRILRDGAGRQPQGIRLMESGAPVDQLGVPHVTGREFFGARAARLKLDVPPALDRPRRATAVRGDLDLDPTSCGRRPASRRPSPRRCWCRWSSAPSRWCCSRCARPTSRAIPGRSRFPAARSIASDASPLDAALREAEEEIGLDRQLIDPIGYLDLYLTFSGFRILPLVARVDPDYRADDQSGRGGGGVRGAAGIPDAAGQPQAPQPDWKEGIERHYYAMPFGERYIWGITAGILRNLYERIYAAMIRPVLTELALFVAPFVAYAVFLWVTKTAVLERSFVAAEDAGEPRRSSRSS